jgi:hypothetical protein
VTSISDLWPIRSSPRLQKGDIFPSRCAYAHAAATAAIYIA